MGLSFGGKTPESIYINNKEVSSISINNDVVWSLGPEDPTDYLYIQNTYDGDNILQITKNVKGTVSSNYYTDTFYYSKNKRTWTEINQSTDITLHKNEKIYFRNDNGKFSYYVSNFVFWKFVNTQSCICGGNINSLLNYQNMNNATVGTGTFFDLFQNNTGLTDCSRLVLPSNGIGDRGYSNMFMGCINMVYPPQELPATSISSRAYYSMFQNCSSMITAPIIRSTSTVSMAYRSMYYGCSLLREVYAPNITSWSTDIFNNWLYGVYSTGVVVKPLNLTIPTNSTSGIPTGWTVRPVSLNVDSSSFTEDSNNSWTFDLDLDSSETNDFSTINTNFPNFSGEIVYGNNNIQFDYSDITSTHHLQLPVSVAPTNSTESITMNIYDYNSKLELVGQDTATVTPYVAQFFNLTNVELHTIATETYQVYGSVNTNITYSRVNIDISNNDSGPGNRNTYMDFTPNDVTNGQLISSNDINIWFGNADTWLTIRVYDDNNLLVYTQDHIQYTII